LLSLAVPSSALAQSTQPSTAAEAQSSKSSAPETGAPVTPPQPDRESLATISGTIVDQTGAAVAGAQVTLTREGQSATQETTSGEDGQFSFDNVAPGP